MAYSCVQLNDLPDEVLMIIFKQLPNIAVLYSLIGVNKRLNKIVHDTIFTNCLTLMTFVSSHLIVRKSISSYFIYPLPDPVLDRFCSQILPEIHDKIKSLYLEPSSIERILAISYPNLIGLGLFNIQEERAIHHFSDETLFTCTLKNQILFLTIYIDKNAKQNSMIDMSALVFTHIFTTFTNLQYLNMDPNILRFQYLSFNTPPTVISSTLLELYVCLDSFGDCLYLLDGRFNQLRILHVNVGHMRPSRLINNNKEILPNLRSFTLHCDRDTSYYDELILPLLHRMSYLEKLDLSLRVWVKKTFLDGNNLKLNIINHMPLLNEFTFNIRSFSRFYNKMNLPSNEDIQHTFKDFQNKQIISSTDYFQKIKVGQIEYSQCHIYSYPYKLIYYNNLTNNFPGGLFQSVREVSLFDQHPFEHEFFLQISQSFPLLEKLTVVNQKRQNNKQSTYENKDLSIIKYPYLIYLDLMKAEKDYHEQFLFDTKTCLPNGIRVAMDYQGAKKATRNFRRNKTRNNCAKMSYVFFRNSKFPEHLRDYFPNVNIRYFDYS